MTGVGGNVAQRNLVRSPETFEVVTINLSWSSPTFGTAKYNEGPPRPERFSRTPCLLLDLADFQNTVFQGSGDRLVHAAWVTTFVFVRCGALRDQHALPTRRSGGGGACRSSARPR